MRHRNRKTVLCVESLEGRMLLSAAPQFTVKVVGSRVVFTGTLPINDSGQIGFVTQSGSLMVGNLTAADGNGSTIQVGGSDGQSNCVNLFYVSPDGKVSGIIGGMDGYTFVSGPNGQGPLQPTPNIPVPRGGYCGGANSLGQLAPYEISVDPTPGYKFGQAINDLGQVVGSNAGEAYLFSSTGTPLRDLGFRGYASGINNNGDITGDRTDSLGNQTSVLLKDGQLFDLNAIDSGYSGHIAIAAGISNNGKISAIDDVGNVLLLTPVPPAPTAPHITWSNPADITYGTPLSSTQLNATADVPGTFTYNVAEGTVLHAGAAQSLVATFTPDDLVHYTTATATASINVLKAPLTVTANNATKFQWHANPPLTGTITGLVNGDTDVVTYSTTATTTSPVGTYPITPTLVDPNYTITFVPGTLTIAPGVNTGVSLSGGVINIQGSLSSGNVALVAIDPSTGNVQVTLNGFIIEYPVASVTQIRYLGSAGGHDSYTNQTNITATVISFAGVSSFTSGTGSTVYYMHGMGNSIVDNGGLNLVYRYGFAVSETGTGTFYNLS